VNPETPFATFCAGVGVNLYNWQREAFGEALRREDGRFVHRLAGISVPRGNGKSLAGAAAGVWRLVLGKPRQRIVSAALDLDGCRVVLDHARQIIRGSPELEQSIEVGASRLTVPSTGSTWTITSREHTASRGVHPDLVVYDEIGWARDDELFASLLAGQASVADPMMLVISTVGRLKTGPLWTIKQLAEGGDK
jgi:phage terminase large subunit-like protein